MFRKLFVAALAVTTLAAHAGPVEHDSSTFPDQPESGKTSVLPYGNATPSRVTYPTEGHSRYRYKRPGVVTCMERTYVLETNQLVAQYGRTDYVKDVMRKGRCAFMQSDDPDFTVERFESYDSPTGHSDLAYISTRFFLRDLNGKPFAMTDHSYVSRVDIAPVP